VRRQGAHAHAVDAGAAVHAAIVPAGDRTARSCRTGDARVRPGWSDARVLEVARTLLYGLVAAASLTTVLATLAVLASGRGRVNGLVFAVAFVIGQTVAVIIALLLGHAASSTGPSWEVGPPILIALGVLVIAFSLRLRRRPVNETPGAGRTEAVLARLERVRPPTVFGIGVSLGIGTKRFAITLVAAASIASADVGAVEEGALATIYIVVATIVVTVPVAAYVVVGPRADELVARSRTWLAGHGREFTFGSLLSIGVLLLLDGLVRILL
jgi:MFS family permease